MAGELGGSGESCNHYNHKNSWVAFMPWGVDLETESIGYKRRR
jgi:hypothetical protein